MKFSKQTITNLVDRVSASWVALIQRMSPIRQVNFTVVFGVIVAAEFFFLLFSSMLSSYFGIRFSQGISSAVVVNAAGVVELTPRIAFIDFLRTFDWALATNPWTDNLEASAYYPPLAIHLVKLIGWLPYYLALGVFLVLLMAFSVAVAYFLANKFGKSNRVILAVLLGLGTTPMLMAFDRGNSVGFMGPLFGLFAYGLMAEKKRLMVVVLAIMISIKLYPVVLLAVLVRKKWFKEIAQVVVSSLIVALHLFLVTPGNMIDSITAFWSASTVAGNERDIWAQEVIGAIFLPFGDTPITAAYEAQQLIDIWKIIRIVALVAMLLLVLFSKTLSDLEVLTLGGFAMVFYYSAPMGYNYTWAPFLAILILSYFTAKYRESLPWGQFIRQEASMALTLLGLLVVSFPTGIWMPASKFSATPYLGWLFGVLVLGVLLWQRAKGLITRGLRKKQSA